MVRKTISRNLWEVEQWQIVFQNSFGGAKMGQLIEEKYYVEQ